MTDRLTEGYLIFVAVYFYGINISKQLAMTSVLRSLFETVCSLKLEKISSLPDLCCTPSLTTVAKQPVSKFLFILICV